ncbi:MAG: hypothetical protein ACLSTO_04645 [Bilophila wadsworthia]
MNFVTLEFATFSCSSLSRAGYCVRGAGIQGVSARLQSLFYALAGMAFVPLLLAVAVLNWGAVHLMSVFQGSRANGKASSRWTCPACGPAGVLQVL